MSDGRGTISIFAFLSAAIVYIARPTADAALLALILTFAGCMVAP